MDPRLRRAVDANVAWYDDIFALHRVASRLEHGLWSSLGPPPPLHSDVVVVEPTVTLDRVVTSLEGRPHAGFKDSFAMFDASETGMGMLFSATWVHRVPDDRSAGSPSAWTAVTTPEELAVWTGRHDTSAVLLPPLLDRAHFKFLARRVEGEIVAGAVARLGSGVVDVSNVYAVSGHSVDWAELAAAVNTLFPGRELVGYERGDDLAAAMAGGFEPVGDLRVWVR